MYQKLLEYQIAIMIKDMMSLNNYISLKLGENGGGSDLHVGVELMALHHQC